MMKFKEFLECKGMPLATINPGSDEFALKIEDISEGLAILEGENLPVLGGDVLAITNNKELAYAYQIWGDKYQYLDWFCNKQDGESDHEYLLRSHTKAKEAILRASQEVEKLGGQTHIVLVV